MGNECINVIEFQQRHQAVIDSTEHLGSIKNNPTDEDMDKLLANTTINNVFRDVLEMIHNDHGLSFTKAHCINIINNLYEQYKDQVL
jgi:hypothetical protein